MMKRKLAVLLVLAVSLSVLFAADMNRQKIYPIDSELYQGITALYRISGHALPSTTGPWSGGELSMMLSRLDRFALPAEAQETYDWIADALEESSRYGSFRLGMTTAVEGYYHTDTSEWFQGRENWIRGFNDQNRFLTLFSDAWIGTNFYGYSEFSLGNSNTLVGNAFGSTSFATNLPLVPPNDMKEFDFNFPYRAFLAAGGDTWSLQVGREQLSWGPGRTGNFVIGDHLAYHNALRASGYSKTFKYTFLTSFFPHPQNYYYYKDNNDASGVYIHGVNPEDGSNAKGQSQYINGISLFMGHRLEWRMFRDKLNVVLTEGAMYMSKDNRLDLIALSPAMIWHNNYTRSLTNSILSLEVDGTPVNGLNIYGQVVIDESILPGEPVPGEGSAPAEPSALGYMLGTTYQAYAGQGVWHVNLEGAYTDPFLYLRDGDLQSGTEIRTQKKGQYGINYVVAVREQAGAGGSTYYNEDFLGYKYGGDAIVANLNGGYRAFGKWNVEGNIFYMAHGTFDKWTVWTRINGTGNPSESPTTPTNSHSGYDNQNRDGDAATRDAVAHTLVLGVSGSYTILPGLDVFGQADYVHIWNPGNHSTNDPVSDLQLSVGVSYSL